jgi:hypothetical protein
MRLDVLRPAMTRWTLLLAFCLGACGGQQDETIRPVAPAAARATNGSKTFWAWFSDHAAELRKTRDLRVLMEAISAELEKAYPGVFAEIGEDSDQLLLVISADGDKKLFPQVQELYAARPSVAGWKIVAFRQRDPSFAIEMEGKRVDPKTAKFVGTPGDGTLDIHVYLPGWKQDDEVARKLGYIVLDHVVGEYDMETRIGGIEFAALEVAPATAKPLTELPAMVDAIKK